MKILCIGDSNTYGYDPRSYIGSRYPEEVRWTDRLSGCKVVNCGVNGMTVPRESGRYAGLISINEPDLVIVMLGTNDMKRKFSYCAMDIAGEMRQFLEKVSARNEFRMDGKMKILLISPPLIGERIRDSWLGDSFGYERAREVSRELASWYRELADSYGCMFLDAAEVVTASFDDSIHLDAAEQRRLAEAIYDVLKTNEVIRG